MSDKKTDATEANAPASLELDEADLDAVAGGAAKKSRPVTGSDPEEGGEFR